MQIRNNQADGLAQSRTSETSGAAQISGVQAKSRGPASTSAGDRVEVSDLAERVNRVVERDATARSEKVSRLESTYLSGQYRVDPAALGSAILQAATKPHGES